VKHYKETLCDQCCQEIEMIPSKLLFKFGEGEVFESKGKLRLPARIGSKSVIIETEIIDANIPMLLSKESLKRAGAVLDFNTDQAELLGVNQQLIPTKSGHYAMPFSPCSNMEPMKSKGNLKEQSICLENVDFNGNYRENAISLHKSFCVCSNERLKSVIQNSKLLRGSKDTLMKVAKAFKSCIRCQHYKNRPINMRR